MDYDSGDARDEKEDEKSEGDDPTNEGSFLDSEEEQIENKKRQKLKEVKLNNSFTGPYP